jgi:hypothetical protein
MQGDHVSNQPAGLMHTAVPASCCAKMRVADRAIGMCELGWRVMRSEVAFSFSCRCFCGGERAVEGQYPVGWSQGGGFGSFPGIGMKIGG